jgi:transposase
LNASGSAVVAEQSNGVKPTQPPASSHPITRRRAGPQPLAEILSGKYDAHLPLYRQSALFAREGVDLDISTMIGMARLPQP